jgi:signal peptidase II
MLWVIFAGREDARIFSLLAGGAIGNLIDRLTLGYVVDFVDVTVAGYHWPAFNVADSALTIGIGWMLVTLVTKKN